ncbi:MAG: toll/interleukin-1 receptor domain-containing protein [Pseudomonadota bacterium]
MYYANNDAANLARVIEGSRFEVREETGYDNWDGGMDGHDVIFHVPDELMGLIPLDTQRDIQNKIREDLNKAASAAESEFVNDVHFEYMDESDPTVTNAATINSSTAEGSAKTRIWRSNSIKMFISHRDTSKAKAHQLAELMLEYGVSCFVAHDSIEPDEDWQNEIEKALQSMDVMLAFITDDLFDSPWTNQEIGYALARDVPVISIKLGRVDPIGFIRNRQAIKGHSSDMRQNAQNIWTTLEKRMAGQSALRNAVLWRFIRSNSFAAASERFKAIQKLGKLTQEEVDKLILAFNNNNQISGCYDLTTSGKFLQLINSMTKQPYAVKKGKLEIDFQDGDLDEEIPF